MTDMAMPARAHSDAWRQEIAATFALGWPMILTTLIEVALTTTNIMLMGRLGPKALAAGTLATNLYFAFMIFGIAGAAGGLNFGTLTVASTPPVATTPLPAALPLLVSALGGLGFAGWRRREAAAA